MIDIDAEMRRARDEGVREAAELVLAMIEQRGRRSGRDVPRQTLEAAYDNIRLIPKLPEDQRRAI